MGAPSFEKEVTTMSTGQPSSSTDTIVMLITRNVSTRRRLAKSHPRQRERAKNRAGEATMWLALSSKWQ
jgi:hypothetical protein